ncbi:MAG: DUF6428 family protein [Flavobacteriaceae bacterium]|nr:DUF6428 family protein [Flavobacteriaceae bacterium]
MKTIEWISVLEQNPDKALLFKYAPNKFVGANYHLTEVKNVQFDTTDCGGKTNFWEETHFQLWENPKEKGKTKFMTTNKILSILKRVDRIKPLKQETALKIEYGNDHFSTSVMPIENIKISHDQIVVHLFAEATRCKANDQCGIDEQIEEVATCCSDINCC